MKFEEYRKYDALGLAELVKNKAVSAEELLETAIERTEEINPKINAVVHRIYNYAKEMLPHVPKDAPFAGVPLLVKDLGLQVKGTPSNVGSKALRKNISPADNFVVQQLRKGGFVFFGQSNTPEFGLTPFTEAKLYGPCHNPWDLAHSPGGSSGGAGAAVAGGISPLATASDGGGSIRIPASCCGLVGLKPSRGLSSFRPFAAESWGGLVVEGCNSRTVRDTAAYLDLIVGNDLGEYMLGEKPETTFLQAIETKVPKLRIGFSVEHTLGLAVDEDCKKAIKHTADLLASLGHEIEEVPLPYEKTDITEVFVKQIAAEVAGEAELFESKVGFKLKRSEVEPNTWIMALLGQAYNAGEYAAARQRVGQLSYRMGLWHQKYDLLLTPTLSRPPIATGALQNSTFESVLVSVINTLGLGSVFKASLHLFSDKIFGYIPYTPLANMTGQPSLSLPLYFSEKGLPIGSMFTAAIGQDTLLLQLARQLEEAQTWFDRVPEIN